MRDRLDGIAVTPVYYGLCWFSLILCVALMCVGLWNAGIGQNEKGYYAMAYLLSLYAAVAVQKNIRDVKPA